MTAEKTTVKEALASLIIEYCKKGVNLEGEKAAILPTLISMLISLDEMPPHNPFG